MAPNKLNLNKNVKSVANNFFLIPIRLVSRQTVGNLAKFISRFIWFWRPIRITFIKETKDITKEKIELIDQKCADLIFTAYKIEGYEDLFKIKHTLLPTIMQLQILQLVCRKNPCMKKQGIEIPKVDQQTLCIDDRHFLQVVFGILHKRHFSVYKESYCAYTSTIKQKLLSKYCLSDKVKINV